MTPDMSERMARQLAGRAAKESKQGAAFRSAPAAFERRVTLDLTNEDHRALKRAALDADTTLASLLRTLVAFWREDEALATRVLERLDRK